MIGSSAAKVIEIAPRVVVGGLRFRDVATGVDRIHGLEVTLEVETRDARRLRAACGPSGIYSFHDVPALRAFENEEVPLPAGLSPPEGRPYRVRVHDPLERYLPTWFQIQLPRPESAPYVEIAGEEPIPLFSSPGRPLPPSYGAVRAQLRGTDENPVAWALLELTRAGQLFARGVSDARGMVVAMFPWPEPEAPMPGPVSPPGSNAIPLTSQIWRLDLVVKRGPAVALDERKESPDLAGVLDQQPVGSWKKGNGTESLDHIDITYGGSTVVYGDSRAPVTVSPANP